MYRALSFVYNDTRGEVDLDDLHDIPGFIIHRTNAKLTSYFQSIMKTYGLTSEQWTVISALDKKDKGMTQKELAEFIDKDQTTLARIIIGMEKRGTIRREMNLQDKRSHYLYLTEKGMKLRELLVPVVEGINDKFAEGISCEEVAQLKYILNKFYDNATKNE